MRIWRVLKVWSVPLVAAAAQTGHAQAPEQAAPPPIRYSAISVSGNVEVPYAPAQMRGFRLADTTRLSPVSDGVQFAFKHDKQVINVTVTPYVRGAPDSPDDATALAEREVAPVRDGLDLAAQKGQLVAYYKFADRADQLHVGARTVFYHWFFAEVQRRGEEGKYIYAAAYAAPSGVVKIRGELPWAAQAPVVTGTPTPMGLAPNGSVVLPGNQGATHHGIGQFAGSVDDRGPSQYIEQFGTFSNALITDMAHHAPEAQAPVTAGPPVAAVQSPPIPAVCTAIPAATDTVTYRVYATLEAPGRGDPLPSGYVDLVLDALHHSFVVPNPLSPAVYVPMVAGANSVMVPVVYGEVGFTLDDQGKVSDIGLTQSSLSAAMNRSLVDAPRRADSMQAFPGQVGVDHPGPIRFFAALSPFQPKSGHFTPLFAVRMPGWRPGSLPGVDQPLDIQPVFPSDAPRPAVGDSVLIQFVVDERGAPVTETLRLLGASHIEYAKAIVDAALHSQYMPAMAAGCPVKGLLERSWRMGSGAP